MLIPRAYSIWPSWSKSVRAAVLVWLLVLAVSVAFALDPVRALMGSYERSQGAFLLINCTILAMARVPFNVVIPPVSVAASISGLWALAQFFGLEAATFTAMGLFDPGITEAGWQRAFGWRAFAGFGNPMAFGCWMAIAMTFLCYSRPTISLSNYSVLSRRALDCAICLAGIGVLLSGTRAAWIALTALLLAQLWRKKIVSNQVFMGIGGIAIICFAMVLFSFRLDSVRARAELLDAALRPAEIALVDGLGRHDTHPKMRLWFGYGPDLQVALLEGNLPQRARGAMPDRVHQMLLDGYLTIGVVGIFSWLWVVFVLYRHGIAGENSAGLALIVGLITWQFGFALGAEKALCALLAGSIWTSTLTPTNMPCGEVERVSGAAVHLVAALFTTFAALSYLPSNLIALDIYAPWRCPERAIAHFERARTAILANQGELALQELDRAVTLDPWRADLARARAKLAIEIGHH